MECYNVVIPEPVVPVAASEFAMQTANDNAVDDNANGWEDSCLFIPAPLVSLTHHRFMHTLDQKWTIDLLKVLDNMNAPDYAFKDILVWARGANSANYSFNPPGGLSWSKSIDLLFDAMPNARQLLPSIVPIACEDGSASNVIVFDFVPQLLSLLQNPSSMIQENLVIDVTCPLKPYQNPNGVLGEALSGSVYAAAYARYKTQPHRQLFVPIIQWIDRTHVTGNGRFSLKPYMFTPAIFTENFDALSRLGAIMAFCQKSNYRRHKTKLNNKVIPYATITSNYAWCWPRSTLLTNGYATSRYRLDQQNQFVLTLLHVFCLLFKICRKVICCVVDMVRTHLAYSVTVGRVMSTMLIWTTIAYDARIWQLHSSMMLRFLTIMHCVNVGHSTNWITHSIMWNLLTPYVVYLGAHRRRRCIVFAKVWLNALLFWCWKMFLPANKLHLIAWPFAFIKRTDKRTAKFILLQTSAMASPIWQTWYRLPNDLGLYFCLLFYSNIQKDGQFWILACNRATQLLPPCLNCLKVCCVSMHG